MTNIEIRKERTSMELLEKVLYGNSVKHPKEEY